MITRYNYSSLIKTLFNNIDNNIDNKEIIKIANPYKLNYETLNNEKLYILDDKIIENIEKICKYINFFENIYQKTKQTIYNFYFRSTKKDHDP